MWTTVEVPKGTLPMNISIERNIATDAYAETYPYIIRIEIVSATKDVGHIYQVPVWVKYMGISKTFGIDICGFRLEAKKPALLPAQAEQLLRGLVNASRLPTYMFVARRAKAVFPVYTIDDEVFAITTVGPVFQHVELAKVREYLSDFLHTAKILGEHGLSDKLHVRGVSNHTLGLRRPVMYLKKRIPGQTDFWAPVFQSGDGRTIYAYAASARRDASRQNGREVLSLRDAVAEALQADNRLEDPYDLRPDRLMPAYWEALQQNLALGGELDIAGIHIPLYRCEDVWLGLETRQEEERYGLFLGRDADDVRSRIVEDFTRRQMIGT